MLKKYLFIGLIQLLIINSVFASCEVLRIVETQVADNLAANKLLRKKLETLGYTTEMISAPSSKEAYELLRLNQADIYLGTWIPLDRDVLNPYILQGKVKTLNKVLPNVQIGIAVNTHLRALGIISIEQLKSINEDLERVIYIGKSDWGIAEKLNDILKHSVYQLKDYKIIRVSNEQLESKLQRAELNKKPIIFYTRKMNVIADKYYATHFLFDTVGVLEDVHSQMNIYSTARYELARQCPKVSHIVQNFQIKDSSLL